MKTVDLERLHNDVKAALIAEIPLGDEGGLTINQLVRLQNELKNELPSDSEQPSSDEKLLTSLAGNKDLPSWYRAALSIFSNTGSSLPVLQGLSVQPRAIQEATKALSWTYVYLLIVLASALLGLGIFYLGSAAPIESFQQDLNLNAKTNEWLIAFTVFVFIMLAIGLTWMSIGGVTKLAMLLGGKRYLAETTSATVLRISQLLVRGGTDAQEAVSLGCRLSGAEPKLENELLSMIQKGDPEEVIASVADCKSMMACKHLAQLKFGTPVILFTVLGGGLTLIYCVIIFSPLYSLFNLSVNGS